MPRQRRTQEERSEASVEKVLEAGLALFSTQGFRATTMREIADHAGLSVGNLYHHFAGKEEIFQRLIDRYWQRLTDPELPLNRLFARGDFPDDLAELAAAIEQVVEENASHVLLIYVDVIEFRGHHIRAFYESMASRFQATYAARFAERRERGELGAVDPMVGAMVATRWFFYFYTVEKCFGVPMHLGMTARQAVEEFIRLIRYGLLPRGPGDSLPAARRAPRRQPAAG
jgi:AcrR family transcriptional regulator